jgi:hypothetical protein
MLSVVGLAVMILTGCDPGKYTGGGVIDSAAGGGQKATFAFNLEAVDRDGDGQIDQIDVPLDPSDPDNFIWVEWWLAKGQFQYSDPAAGVQFHFDCDLTLALDANKQVESSVSFVIDEAVAESWQFGDPVPDNIIIGLEFFGSYTSRKGNGQLSVILHAKGDAFGASADTIEVTLYGGPYDGYHNSGTVQGGNIQWHPAKSK